MTGPVLLATVIMVLSSYAAGRVTIVKKEKTCWDGSQKDYRGTIKETISRQSCMKYRNTLHYINMEQAYCDALLEDMALLRTLTEKSLLWRKGKSLSPDVKVTMTPCA